MHAPEPVHHRTTEPLLMVYSSLSRVVPRTPLGERPLGMKREILSD